MSTESQISSRHDTRFRGISPRKRRDRLVERMMQSSAGVFEIFSVYLGHRLGYYQHLPAARGVTSGELARLLHCLPVSMAQQPSRAAGTVMRPDTLRGYALEAGFRDMQILPVENYFLRLYRMLV